MDAQWWIVLAVVGIIVAVIAYRRSVQARERGDQDRRVTVQARGQADLPGDQTSQREDRRLAGMSADDREWEQASLGRDRDVHARADKAEGPDNL